MLVEVIKLQDKMELPIGLVMKASGIKPPDSHLVDSILALRRMKIAKYALPLLVKKEKKLRLKIERHIDLPENAAVSLNSDVEVY